MFIWVEELKQRAATKCHVHLNISVLEEEESDFSQCFYPVYKQK